MKDIFTDEDYQIWRLVLQARNAMHKARNRELAEYNLTTRQAAILQIAKATNGDATPYKIAKWTILEPHALLTVLKNMERKNLVKRVKKVGKRRATGIVLTNQGRIAYEQTVKFEPLHTILNSLSKEERNQLKRILKILRDEGLKQLGVSRKMPFPPF